MAPQLTALCDLLEKAGERPDWAKRDEFQYAMGFLHGMADVVGMRNYERGSADSGVFEIEEDDREDWQK